MSDHYAWLIERGTTPGDTEWWSGDGVTKDVYQAVWFPTRAAAELTIQTQRLGGYWFATEHGFIAHRPDIGLEALMPEKLRTSAARWLRDHNPIDVFPMDTDELERRLVMVEEQAYRAMLHEVAVAVKFRHDQRHSAALPCEACPVPFQQTPTGVTR